MLRPDPSAGRAPLALYTEVERPPRDGRPWVLANFVAGVDGAVAVDGRVGALTSDTDQELFRTLRSLADVVLVGAGTVRAERYGPVWLSAEQIQARLARGQTPAPPLAVVSGRLDLDWDAPLFTAATVPTVVVTTTTSPPDRRERAAEVADVVVAGEGRVDVMTALRELWRRGADVVLCEGGPALLAELVAARAVDELCLTLASVLGGDPLRLLDDAGGAPRSLVPLDLQHVLASDRELFLRYLVRDDGETRP